LSSIERQELAELRQSVELLQQQNSDLRNDKLKMTSQITEHQNQNAQLIEDHTRDVLQIKAKETQLVRARSDAENAEERANSLSKEIDRLKRELSRLGRGRAGSDVPFDPSMTNGDSSAPAIRPAYGSARSYNVPGARSYGVENHGEGKENIPDSTATTLVNGGLEYSKLSGVSVPTSASRPMSHGSSGRATPASADGGDNGSRSGSFGGGSRNSSGVGSGEGVESWRRAAEVTQNLKARIEMMKVSLNFTLWTWFGRLFANVCTGEAEYWTRAITIVRI
jgi:cytoskeleton-associated protein 5